MSQKRTNRPKGEAGRYLSDDQFYKFYIELVLKRESVLKSSAKAGINRNTGYKLAKEFDALPPGEIHPRISEIESRDNTMATQTVWLDTAEKGKKALKFERQLDKFVVGQQTAKDAIIEVYETWDAGFLPPNRPVGNFLFLGPTGSGKTHIVEAVGLALLGKPTAVTKIDCAEFQHSHEIAKLIGSPPGYLGHRETHPILSQEAIGQYSTDECPLSLVLFDEIEKASDALWKLLLGILDKAILTLGDNRRVDFSKTMIFMTSNLGQKTIQSIAAPKWFNVAGTADLSKIAAAGIGAAKKHFTTEFFNRLDHVVVFDPLTREMMGRVLEMRLTELQYRVSKALGFSFNINLSDPAKEELLRVGFSEEYGARHLKRALFRHIEQPLARLINSGQVSFKRGVLVEFEEGKFKFAEIKGGIVAA